MADGMRTAFGRIAGVLGKVLAYLVMGVFAFMTLSPIVWLLVNSVKSTAEYRLSKLSLPHDWAWINYPGAWRIGEFDKLIGNSVIYTLGASLGIILFSILAGFAFAKIRSKATAPIYGSFVIGILLSIQSLMYIEQFNSDIGKFKRDVDKAIHNNQTYLSDKTELKQYKINKIIQLLIDIYKNQFAR